MIPGQRINVKDFLPSANTVKANFLEMSSEDRDEDKTRRLKEALAIRGAMSCDGLKQKHTGTKVYDLTLHYFQESSSNNE